MTVLAPDPLAVPPAHDDPCDDARRIGHTLAYLHVKRPVRCAPCGRPMRYAWWVVDHHECGRCRFGPGHE